LVEVGLSGGAELLSLEVSDLAPNRFLDSQLAMDSSVSWRRVWCLRTCQQGTKTVQISMTKMERAILVLLV
jgi:hypothetical protein